MFDNKQKIDILAKTPLFLGWTDEELADIVKYSGTDLYKKGDIIFDQDQKGDRFYVILEGNIVILSPEDNTAIAEFVEGELFGETAMLTGTKQGAIASANEDTTILSFPKNGKNIAKVFDKNLSAYAHLLKSFLVTVSKRTRKANSLIKENSPIMQELQKQVYGDKLTGLFNRAYLEENISDFMKNKFSLIMMKPDNFKLINDTHGHDKGDKTLIFVGNFLSQILSTKTILIRYEGNEFAIVCPHHSKKETISLAKKVKTDLENLDLSSVFNDDLKLSMSLGILFYPETNLEDKAFISLCAKMPLIGRARGGSQIIMVEDLNEEDLNE